MLMLRVDADVTTTPTSTTTSTFCALTNSTIGRIYFAMGKGAQTREKILDAAFRLAARDGLTGLSLSQLAGQLGVSKSGLFAHFRSKEDLQLETLRAVAARFEEAVGPPAFLAPRGPPRLRPAVGNWGRCVNEPPLPGGGPPTGARSGVRDREG